MVGARLCNDLSDAELFELIVGSNTGEALVFCPSAMLDFSDGEARRLNEGFVRARIRNRLTADGGRSILASDRVQQLQEEEIPTEEIIVSFSAGTRALKAAAKPTPGEQNDEFVGASSSAGIDTDDEQTTTASNASQSTLATISRAPKTQNRSKPAPRQAPSSTQNTQRRTDVSRKQAKPYVKNAVSRLLKKSPERVSLTHVRNNAAHAAGLHQGFFESNEEWKTWSQEVIKKQALSETPPVCLSTSGSTLTLT